MAKLIDKTAKTSGDIDATWQAYVIDSTGATEGRLPLSELSDAIASDFDAAGTAASEAAAAQAAAIAALGGADSTVTDEQLRNWAGQLPKLMTSVTRTFYSNQFYKTDGVTLEYSGVIAVSGTVTWPDGVTGHVDGAEYPHAPGVLQWFTASHDASGKIVVQSPLADGAAGLTIVTPDYYVDSSAAAGGDGSLATPFNALSDLSLANNDIVALKSGSVFSGTDGALQESALTGVSICRYSAGNEPLIDGSLDLSAYTFTQDGTYTNCWKTTIPEADLDLQPIESWINVWENDEYLRNQTSQATLNSTAGGYWVSAHVSGADVELWIHASDSGNVNTNGSTYEITAREHQIKLGDNATIDGIRVRRNLGHNGAIVVGRNATLRNCRADDGGKHNVFYKDGSALYGVICENAYFGGASAVMFVYNENTPASLGLSHYGCAAFLSGDTIALSQASVSGFSGHKNTSGDFGEVTYTKCYAGSCFYGLSSPDSNTGLSVDRFYGYNNSRAVLLSDAGATNPTFKRSYFGAASGSSRVFDVSNYSGTLTINNCWIDGENLAEAVYNAVGLPTIVEATTFNDDSVLTGNARCAIKTNHASSKLTVKGCRFTGGNWRTYVQMTLAGTMRIDNNIYSENAAGPFTFSVAGTSYANVAGAWIGATISGVAGLAGLATTQDRNSQVLDV